MNFLDFSQPHLQSISKLRSLCGLMFDQCDIKATDRTQNRYLAAHSVLLYGPSGNGKTQIVKTVANDLKAHIITCNPYDFVSGIFRGNVSFGISSLFRSARKESRCILLIENAENTFPITPSGMSTAESSSLLHSFIGELKYLKSSVCERSNNMVVVCIVCDIAQLHSRIAECMDDRILLDYPTSDVRFQMLVQSLKSLDMRVDSRYEVIIRGISDSSIGYVWADVTQLCQIAIAKAKECKPEKKSVDWCSCHDSVCGENNLICPCHIQTALDVMTKNNDVLREKSCDFPTVHFSDIGGLTEIKQRLNNMIGWNSGGLNLNRLADLGVSPISGVLIYGPSGTGKSLLALATAKESGWNVIICNLQALVRSEIGAGERSLNEIFIHAKHRSPSIILIDELQAVFSSTESSNVSNIIQQLVNEFDSLTQWNESKDSVGARVVVIGITNAPWDVSPNLLRPERFECHIHVTLPQVEERTAICNVLRGRMRIANEVSSEWLADITENFTGADIENLFRKAGIQALSSAADGESGVNMREIEIKMENVTNVIENCRPSVSLEVQGLFATWRPGQDVDL